jgi:LAO/AO transport system kinase
LTIISGFLRNERRALARAISIVENEGPQKEEILKITFPLIGNAYIIGFTGPPGSGKSSLVSKLIYFLRQEGLKVGVIAVDPTSPFTGGAILGDRIRMQEHTGDREVFIRSMGARGSLGGLSGATRNVIQLMDACGKDIIIVETVGVGQSEVDIAKNADSTIVVLTPAGGDSVQTIKAGIMEIADIFVVNKSDLPNAERTRIEINNMLDLVHKEKWRPPVVKAISLNNEGIEELWTKIQDHRRFLEKGGHLENLRKERIKKDTAEHIEQIIKKMLMEKIISTNMFEKAIEKINNRETDPLSAAQDILHQLDKFW